ncbi:hypothetical protein CBS101457_002037 [Exobasidium rhododendri]|nr:hypothetical protein CBS101457_002037 [Exobasidium rhododendri]
MLARLPRIFTVTSILLVIGSSLAAPLPMEGRQLKARGKGKLGRAKQVPAQAVEARKDLILHTDAKFDDKLAALLAERMENYGTMHVVLNGINDHEGALGDMHLFRQKMKAMNEKMGSGFRHADTVHYYRGGSPFMVQDKATKEWVAEKMGHEELFNRPGMGTRVPKLHRLEDLEAALGESKSREAHIYQIGPTPEREVLQSAEWAAKSGKLVTQTGHIVGYNTRQDRKSRTEASQETQNFAVNFARNMKEKSRNENNKVILSNSQYNFRDKDGKLTQGTTQPYHVLDGRVPQEDLDQVGRLELFHLSQLHKSNYEIEQEPGHRALPYVGLHGDLTEQETWMMRLNDEERYPGTNWLREQNLPILRANLAHLIEIKGTEKNNVVSRLKSVLVGLEEGCMVEACDANHIALHHIAVQNEKLGHRDAVQDDNLGSQSFHPVTIKTNVRLEPATHPEEVHGVSPNVYPSAKAHVTHLIQQYLPKLHLPESHQSASSSSSRPHHQPAYRSHTRS